MKTDDIFFPVLATLPQPVMCFLGPYPSFKWLTHLQDVLLTGCVCDWSWFNWWYRIKFFLSIIYNVFIIFYLELDISYIWAEGEEYFPSLEFSVRLNRLVKVVGLIRRPSTVRWRKWAGKRFRLNMINTVFVALTLSFSFQKLDFMRSISCWSSLTAILLSLCCSVVDISSA